MASPLVGLAGLRGSELLAVLVVTNTGRRSTVAAAVPGANAEKRNVSLRIFGGGVELAYRTILPWMAHETQYWSFRYILGTEYSAKTEASEISPVIVY